MDHPTLPPVLPGRSALPAFLAVERDLGREIEAEAAKTETQVRDAGEEAERIRREGTERLERVLVDAQESAMRAAEAEARERVNAARSAVGGWVDEAARAAETAVDGALDVCCGD